MTRLALTFTLLPTLACGPLVDEGLDLDIGPISPASVLDTATLACASLDGLDVQLIDPPGTCEDIGLPKTVCEAGHDGGPVATLVCCSLDGLDCALVDPPETCEALGYPKTVCSAG